MKTNGKFNGMSFGFSTVNAGQRNVNVEPQLIATSTEGTFRATAPVTKALGIEHGDYIMFIQNIDNINKAIAKQDPMLVEYCENNGLDITTTEAAIAIHKEFDMVGIAKGNWKVTMERLSKKDKITRISQNYDQYLQNAMENAPEEIKDAITRDGISKDEIIEILTQFVVAEELPKFKGSKAANTAALAGIGTTLNFTDTNVWKQLKADLSDEEAKNINREYSIDLDNIQTVEINDGYKKVPVNVLLLGEFVDKEPVRRTAKNAE